VAYLLCYVDDAECKIAAMATILNIGSVWF